MFRRMAVRVEVVGPEGGGLTWPSVPRSSGPIDATTAALRHDAAPTPLAAVVRVLGALATPATFRLGLGSCVVGAGAGAHVVISEPTVSRKHVELTLVPEGVAVRDLGSRNGTFYLGQRVERIVLALGSRIKVGAVEIALDVDAEALGARLPDDQHGYRGLVGVSPAMRRLFAILERLEGSLANVLVQGESGVGKELVARAIHDGSSRANRPLLVVNCGGIARELVLSELFGHKRGAFTGAIEQRVGAFEAADGGTLFLDEIGELPLDVQPALLRVLESGEVRPVGENEARKVSVRIVAATNRDLEADVAAGRFRGDLYYRLAVVKLAVPPLRERPEDIEPVVAALARASGVGELPADMLESFRRKPWPGNVREVRNAVEAYVAVGVLPEPAAADLQSLDNALRQLIDPGKPYAEQKEVVAERFSRNYLQLLLARTGGNQSEAARISGLERSYLGKLLAKYGIGKS
jgi:two-component system, NtrC family, nitrogen regulation response regulator GlnG